MMLIAAWLLLCQGFFCNLGRGPRAFQIGKISAVNQLIWKFFKQKITAFTVNLKTNKVLHILYCN